MFIRALLPALLRAPDDAGGAPPAPAADASASSGQAPATPPAAPIAFAETLPEDLRNDAAFRNIKDLPGLAKSYLHATKMIGGRPQDLIKLPGPDDEAGWADVFGKLGRPADAKGYAFKAPEGVQVDEKLQSAFAETAHKTGLTAKQAEGLYGWWNAAAAEARTAAEAARVQQEEAGLAALKSEWGAAFDQKLELAKRALAEHGDKDFEAYLTESRLGNHPAMLKLMAKLGAQLAEDGDLPGGGANRGVLSPTEAKQQINALKGGSDPQFSKAWQDKRHPQHAEAQARMDRLYAFAYPDT